ncbi:rhomboid family intramembrane serine protease GlpG [Rheinheimera baltica]|uniref:rhomboid family intramembrane serine protease GlpG n=1 Tax=Rheinheimera baltica TaxID=67576 RepID=UPI00273DD4AC|nr:rhomboid family intramembrane serine protease GlpG [Rheinheimera baltica]MDP5144262.1 rhomboid family intramembrane serine protease GlpG [Rheinheimera baltica]MDP5151520.1 rhomboid family intramembrane serine protease GlpG [Rheinheimera baltica]MDP5188440.1 rhomboid family intramembrane serine protease GlpG [Rheinheimera baltica]
MHKFAELNSARAAQLFADYCTAQGLDVSAVVQRPDCAELYASTEQLAQVEHEFSLFMQQPSHPRYQAAAWQLSQPTNDNARVLPQFNPLALWHQAPVTLAVLVLCLLVYAWQQVDWRGSSGLLQLSDPVQLWRWFTPMLLHFSLTHLVFNVAWWWYLGRQLEQRQGAVILLNITLSVALISNAMQYFMVGPQFGGLSGVVYGLFGYFWLTGRLNPAQGLQLSSGMAGFMLLWLVLGFMDVLWISMANWAHLGGLVAGLGWAWLLRRQHGPKTPQAY